MRFLFLLTNVNASMQPWAPYNARRRGARLWAGDPIDLAAYFRVKRWQCSPGGTLVATKVRYFGVKSTRTCTRVQMGTRPAKVTHRPPRGRPKRLNQGFSSRPKTFGRMVALVRKGGDTTFCKKVLRSAGGPKLLKWGLPGRGARVKSAKVPPTPYVYYPGCQCYLLLTTGRALSRTR